MEYAVPGSSRPSLSNREVSRPWASSGTAATAGASILRSREDVLPEFLIFIYLLQNYDFSLVKQNNLAVIFSQTELSPV